MKPRRQCPKCPWKKGVDARQIPNGYSLQLHEDLRQTIAEPARSCSSDDPLHIMGCHASNPKKLLPCVGWIVNQLGPGNNILLRLRVMLGRFDANVEPVGPQHERFEDTFPEE